MAASAAGLAKNHKPFDKSAYWYLRHAMRFSLLASGSRLESPNPVGVRFITIVFGGLRSFTS
jgi:hypothetical protein